MRLLNLNIYMSGGFYVTVCKDPLPTFLFDFNLPYSLLLFYSHTKKKK